MSRETGRLSDSEATSIHFSVYFLRLAFNLRVHEDVVAYCTNLDHAFPHDVIDRYLA